MFLRPILDDQGTVHDQQAIMETFREIGDTNEVALDALERRVRTALAEAISPEPENNGR